MIIQVEQRHVYGQIKYYPLNELASRFAALMKEDSVRQARVIKAANIRLES